MCCRWFYIEPFLKRVLYAQQGGLINIYAKQYDDYVEISIEDNGRGLSDHDIALIRDEKIYDSKEIGVNDLLDENDTLLLSKGSGFGLMNCKGIIEKYKKTNPIFKNCLFGVDSKLNVGSRFYFKIGRASCRARVLRLV